MRKSGDACSVLWNNFRNPRSAALTGDAVMASAALDRLLHRATVINIKGESYRMKEKRLTGLFPGAVALPDSPKGGTRTKTK